jgi:uncharacterized membrane protein YoaK (UPF0700 family)
MSGDALRAAPASPSLQLTKIGIAVALTFIAGYVDAIGWLTLDRVFTAQMSGNLVLLAVHMVAGESEHVWLQADALIAFFVGLVITGGVIEIGVRRRHRRIFVAAMAVEFVLLSCFALAGEALLPGGGGEHANAGPATYTLIAVVAVAMGAQNTSLRMAGILSVFTTHMTGALSGLSEELIVCIFSLLQPRNRRKAGGGFAAGSLQEKHPKAFKNIGQSGALLIAFFAGAYAGAAAFKAVGVAVAMSVPLVIILLIGIIDWRIPLTEFPSPAEKE